MPFSSPLSQLVLPHGVCSEAGESVQATHINAAFAALPCRPLHVLAGAASLEREGKQGCEGERPESACSSCLRAIAGPVLCCRAG